MRAVLLEPPATDPRSPHLAMANLHAALAEDDIDVSIIDAGAEALHWLLDPARIASSLESLPRNSDTPSFLARLGPSVVEGAGRAVATLRDPERFYDPGACDEARELIGRALQIHSTAHGAHRYGIAPIRYDGGVDPAKLADLRAATARPGDSMFGDFFADVAGRVGTADVVAISILNHQQILPGLTLARMLHEQGRLVVIGGTVYAKFADELRTRPEFFELFCTAVCPYEGETALRALCAEVADSQQAGRAPLLSGLPNLLWVDRRSGRVEAGPVHVEDVDSLPTPNFDGFDLTRYLTPLPVLPILTGKGCYFNRCTFCDIPFINTVSPLPYRRRRPERVAGDIAALFARYGAEHFVITDEALSPRFLGQLCAALDGHPEVRPRMVGYARLEPGFTEETCRTLAAHGVRRLFFGLESGSQRLLDRMDKGITVPVAREVVRNCAAAGIGFHLFSMLGLPEETTDDAQETLDFFLDTADVIDHPRNTFDVHRFSLDLRTRYFDEAEQFGIQVDRAALAALDFPLDAPAWRSVRGHSRAELETAAARIDATLRRRFLRSRAFPAHVYPSFEEYSVLYSDRFADDDGTWSLRFALPDPGSTEICALSWSESLSVAPVEGGYLLTGVHGERRLSAAALHLLRPPPPPSSIDTLVAGLVQSLGAPTGGPEHDRFAAELRTIVDDLLLVGLLRLEVVGVGAEVVGQPA